MFIYLEFQIYFSTFFFSLVADNGLESKLLGDSIVLLGIFYGHIQVFCPYTT